MPFEQRYFRPTWCLLPGTGLSSGKQKVRNRFSLSIAFPKRTRNISFGYSSATSGEVCSSFSDETMAISEGETRCYLAVSRFEILTLRSRTYSCNGDVFFAGREPLAISDRGRSPVAVYTHGKIVRRRWFRWVRVATGLPLKQHLL